MDNPNSKLILNNRKVVMPRSVETEIELFSGSINLFIVWYAEKHAHREKEYNDCLERNLSNKFINRIYILVEQGCECKFDNEKIFVIETKSRVTYKDVFGIVNSVCSHNDINIIANTDIYFDTTIKYVFGKLDQNKAFCLTRWDIKEKGGIEFHNRRDSQDAWIFYGKIKDNINCEFYLGIPGCDNKIAYELEKAGYAIHNPSLTIRIYHLHLSKIRNYIVNDVRQKLPRPYQMVSPCTIQSVSDNNRKILHIGLNFEGQQTLTKALKSLGEYIYIDWRKKLNDDVVLFNKFLISAVDRIMPDFIFMQIQTADVILPSTIEAIKKLRNVPILNWNGDIRNATPKWMIDLAKFDNVHTGFTNGKDIETFQKLGIENVHYIQIGFEENVYNADVKPLMNAPKIVFTGTLYGDRFPLSELRKEMFDKLKKEFGNSFQAYGGNWKEMGGENSLPPISTAALYKGADIAISVNNINAHRYTSDRLLNILGTGTFCLAQYVDGLNLDFEHEKHLVYWNTVDELIALIKKYQLDKNKRQEIAYNGMVEVWDKHRWSNRMQQIKLEILKW